MRKTRYLIGLVAALVASLAAAAVGQAAVTGQTLTVSVGGTKQDNKIRGPVSIDVNLATTETAPTPPPQTASHTDLDLDRDFAFFPGRLGQCNPTSLIGTTTDQAKAVCAGAQVGFGDATACSAVGGCGAAQVPVTVTAFNGPTTGGAPTLLLHAKTGGLAAASPPLVLTGTLIPSPRGFPYGMRLSVEIPDTAATGLHLTNFHVFVSKLLTVTPTKKQKAKCRRIDNAAKRKQCLKRKKKFYAMARCSDRTWDFQSETQFRNNAPTQSSKTSVTCAKA
jgi:hypothetical protein